MIGPSSMFDLTIIMLRKILKYSVLENHIVYMIFNCETHKFSLFLLQRKRTLYAAAYKTYIKDVLNSTCLRIEIYASQSNINKCTIKKSTLIEFSRQFLSPLF